MYIDFLLLLTTQTTMLFLSQLYIIENKDNIIRTQNRKGRRDTLGYSNTPPQCIDATISLKCYKQHRCRSEV